MIIPSAHILTPRPPHLLCGRADYACTNLLSFFVRYVRSRGSMRLRRAVKPPTFTISFAARTRHARLLRLTRARGKSSQREWNALFADFWYFWSRKSTINEKFLYDSIGSSRRRPLQTKTQVQPTEKAKNIYFIPSALLLYPRPPCTFSGRADNACTNLLGFFV